MDNPPYPQLVAKAVKQAMADAGQSEASLAEASGIPRVTLRRRLAAGNFTVTELAAIAKVLGTTVADLIEPASAAS